MVFPLLAAIARACKFPDSAIRGEGRSPGCAASWFYCARNHALFLLPFGPTKGSALVIGKDAIFILPRVEPGGMSFRLAHDVAFVGEAEVFDETVWAEEDFGGLDFHEGPGVGNLPFPVLAAPDPDFSVPGDVFAGRFAPGAEDLAFGHANANLRGFIA